jgi:hypothetical protein
VIDEVVEALTKKPTKVLAYRLGQGDDHVRRAIDLKPRPAPGNRIDAVARIHLGKGREPSAACSTNLDDDNTIELRKGLSCTTARLSLGGSRRSAVKAELSRSQHAGIHYPPILLN